MSAPILAGLVADAEGLMGADQRDFFGDGIVKRAIDAFADLALQDIDARIATINRIRLELHRHSPLAAEPVDCVVWVPAEAVSANDYNPNTVAPPEMRLLEHSITEDGYTQPIVAWESNGGYEVVDGFHRNRVGRESPTVRTRTHGYLPLTIINEHRQDRNDRIAATIRHNRARGKHRVDAMSDIVVELKRRNWSDERICKELGMDADEVLRLCQITGLAELFADRDFSKSWDVEGEVTESDFEELSDDVSTYGDEASAFRTVNTGDARRIFHTWEKWECHKAGFYASHKDGMSKAQCEEAYRDFLSEPIRFAEALEHVIAEWIFSCEHYLTNSAMNRIAWLGQAAMCYATGVPAVFRGGYHLLSQDAQLRADEIALVYLNKWLVAHGREQVSLEVALGGRQVDIY